MEERAKRRWRLNGRIHPARKSTKHLDVHPPSPQDTRKSLNNSLAHERTMTMIRNVFIGIVCGGIGLLVGSMLAGRDRVQPSTTTKAILENSGPEFPSPERQTPPDAVPRPSQTDSEIESLRSRLRGRRAGDCAWIPISVSRRPRAHPAADDLRRTRKTRYPRTSSTCFNRRKR
jgi:hypothetical protein